MAAKAVERRRRRARHWLCAAFAVAVAVLAANTVLVDRETRAATPRDGGDLVDTGVIRANVRVQGAGPAVVLIHGFSAAIDWWDAIAPALAADHRVVSVDLIGHGGTAAPDSDYSIERQAALVATVLDRLGVDRVAIIGHSMGGEVATALVEARPDRIYGLVLIDSPPTAAANYGLLTRLYLTPVVGELLSHFRIDPALRSGLAQGFAPGFKVPENFVDDVRQVTYTAFRSAHDASIAFRTEKPTSARLAAVKPVPPLLAIAGSLDAMVAPENVRLFGEVSGAKIVTLDGLGHSPMVEAPAMTLKLIKSFLAGRQ